MFKSQMKFQKIIAIVLLIFSALSFLYAIGLATDVYPLFLLTSFGFYDETVVTIFTDIQPYNNQLVVFSIVAILASVLPFIFATSTRRKYYLDNYISSGIQVAVYVAFAIFLFVNSANYKAEFLSQVNLQEYAEYCKEMNYFFSGSTIWFDLGFVLGALFLVACGIIAGNFYWKYKIVKAENELIKGE